MQRVPYLPLDKADEKIVHDFLAAGDYDDYCNYVNRFIRLIHIAAKRGNLEIVKLLIEKYSQDLDTLDSQGETPLILALLHKHTHVAKYLLQFDDVDVNARSQEQERAGIPSLSALELALDIPDSELAIALIKAGANANRATLDSGKRIIHVVAEQGKLEILETILEKNQDLLNQTDKRNQTLLSYAAGSTIRYTSQKSKNEVVKYLIAQGADLNIAINCLGYGLHRFTALMVAIFFGNEECAITLIKAGANVNATNDEGKQSIHLAAEKGALYTLITLLEKYPALLDQVDNNSVTPIIFAAQQNKVTIVDYLITQQAKLDGKVNGKTLLTWAIEAGHTKTAIALIHAGVDITTDQPIFAAIEKNDVEVFKALIEKDKNLVKQIEAGHTTLLRGTTKNRLEIVKAIVEQDESLINQTDDINQTPLLHAAANGFVDIVNYFISKNADLNKATDTPGINPHGKTPLHWAIKFGETQTVTALINAGATLGESKRRPIDLAVIYGQLEIVKDLAEKNPELIADTDSQENTLLFLAAVADKLEIVDYLFSKGARLNKGEETKISEQMTARIELLKYIHDRALEPEYKTTYTLFGHAFNFGFSRGEKIAAANALKEVAITHTANNRILKNHRDALKNGELEIVYDKLRRNRLC